MRKSLFTAAAAVFSFGSVASSFAAEPASDVGNPGYYTYHFDRERTGWNPKETILSTDAVASKRFGLVRTLVADSVVYAQPLYAPKVKTRFGTRNIVYIASEGDSVYAYDADNGELLWHRNFTNPGAGITAVSRDSVADCNAISPTIGISSTPVIDPVTKTLYVVDKIQTTHGTNTTYENDLHALDLSSGADRLPAVAIGGTATLEDGTVATFNDQRQQNRPGLVLANGAVYVAFGSSCDAVPGGVHGWMFAFSAATLQKLATLDTTASSANAYLGAIWQSTIAPAVDPSGDLFFATGNGTFDANSGHRSYGDSILRTSPRLAVRDYFAPKNDLALEGADQDVGSAGVMLVPARANRREHLAIGGVKSGTMFLLDRDRLGHFDATADHILQEVTLENSMDSLYGGPAYYAGTVFWGAGEQPMQSFALSYEPVPHLTATTHSNNTFPGEGGEIPGVSSDGTKAGSAVVWATTRASQGGPILLYAYDARDLSKTLFAGFAGTWRSTGDAFLTPTIVAGHVFVPGDSYGVAEFGLR